MNKKAETTFDIAYRLRKEEKISDEEYAAIRETASRAIIPEGSVPSRGYGEDGSSDIKTVVCPRCCGRGSEILVTFSSSGEPEVCRKCKGHRICYQQTKTWAIPAADLEDPFRISARPV